MEQIKAVHPRAKDMHAYIRQNDASYKAEFMRAYNCKCDYCGASIDILPKEMFEIDHFVYEKSFVKKLMPDLLKILFLHAIHVIIKRVLFPYQKKIEMFYIQI